MNRVGSTTTAICAVVAVLVLAPAARADGTAPQGAVGGWSSPAEGVLKLDVHANRGDAPITTASVVVDGATVVTGGLCGDAASCDGGAVQLRLDTTKFGDGFHHLAVTVADADGGSGTIFDDPSWEVRNTQPPYSSTAVLTIGSGVPAPPPPQGGGQGGGVLGASASSCVKPKLSMRLSQRPLRIRHGVPVLAQGKRYRFTGRLTCLRNGKRVSAPKRTRIVLRAIMHGKSHAKGHASVGSRGKIVVRIASPSSRTLEFRFTTPDRKVTRVRIKITTVKVHKHRKHHKKG